MDRKHIESALKKAAEEWQETFDAIKDPIMLLDRDQKILRVNKAAAAFIGLSIADIPGRKCCSVLCSTIMEEQINCPFKKMMRTKSREEIELCVDKERGWFSVSVDPVFDDSGEISGAVHVTKNITERKRAEDTIRKSEEKYRNIFENSLEGIFQTSAEGKFISVNKALANMLGFDSPEELICTIHDVARQLYPKTEDRELWLKTLKENGFTRRHETQVYRKDGGIIWVSLSARVVKDVRNRTAFYEGTVEDITKRKITELELRKVLSELELKNKELEEAYAAQKESQKKIFQQEKMASIGQLAAGVAHEINNPMGFIISNLNSLQKYTKRLSEFINTQSETIDKLPGMDVECRDLALKNVIVKRKELKVDYVMEDLQNIINESLDGADRVKRIVQDLKSFSRVDDTGYSVADINKSLESTLNIVWNEIKYKAKVIKEYGEIPAIQCNPGQLSQAFMNILVNASHAIPDFGEITIKTWHDEKNVYVAISDTGTGIPEDLLPRIFEPFYTTKEVGKGTGLGLSIVYDIMKKHNGEISVTSTVGKGTTFVLRVPKEAHNNG